MPEAPRGLESTLEGSRRRVPWTWVGAGDEATALRAERALAGAGAVRPGERAFLSRALRHVAGGADDVATAPWASWAMRLAERSGLDGCAGEVALAVAALCAPGAGPDALGRASIAARALGGVAAPPRVEAWMLRLGEHPAARQAALENPTDEDRARFYLGRDSASAGRFHVGRDSASAGPSVTGTREAVALCTIPALVAGEDPAPWALFGAAIALPIGLLEALAGLWIDAGAPGSGALDGPACTPLLAAWLADPALAPRLLLALAGERTSRARRREIHALVADRPFRARLAERAEAALGDARAALPGGRLAGAGAELAGVLAERFRFYDGLMAFRAALGGGRAPAPRREAEEDAAAALALLAEAAPWRASWEVQRFGVLGSAERPVAHWFVRALILQALAEAGEGAPAEVERLLLEAPPGELRHYDGFRGAPPDGDLLGLALELAGAAPAGAIRDRAETWIEVLLANAGEDGLFPTWLPRGPAGEATGAADVSWAGDDCTAVRLRLLCGLLVFDARRFEAAIRTNARSVLARAADGTIEGSYYYDVTYAALLFSRFARLHRERCAGDALAGAIDAAEAACRARALAAQRLDGGWGTPQRTAACLELVAAAGPAAPPLALARGARYLGEAQLADGAWPAEPLYPIPMKRGRAGRHRGRELTTALCARALRIAARALARAEEAP